MVLRGLVDDPGYAPWRDFARTHRYAAALGLPLICDGAVLGALSLFAPEHDAFSANEIQLLEGMAAELSLGILALRGKDAARRAGRRTRCACRRTWPRNPPE